MRGAAPQPAAAAAPGDETSIEIPNYVSRFVTREAAHAEEPVKPILTDTEVETEAETEEDKIKKNQQRLEK